MTPSKVEAWLEESEDALKDLNYTGLDMRLFRLPVALELIRKYREALVFAGLNLSRCSEHRKENDIPFCENECDVSRKAREALEWVPEGMQ